MFENPAYFAALFGQTTTFSPLSLFVANRAAQGVWFDPSDFSTMFQDNLGATPVTATTQSVGLILDKSGKANHASQSNASFKPTLQQDASGFYYLSFDGTDDFMTTSAIDFTGNDKMSVFAGVRKTSDATVGIVAELSANSGANSGTFGLFAPSSSLATTYSFRSRGTGEGVPVTPSSYAAPVTNVLGCLGDIANDGSIIRVNGAQVASAATDQGSGTFGNHVLYMGRRGGSTLAFSGRIYSFTAINAALTAAQIDSTETWVNSKTGAY